MQTCSVTATSLYQSASSTRRSIFGDRPYSSAIYPEFVLRFTCTSQGWHSRLPLVCLRHWVHLRAALCGLLG